MKKNIVDWYKSLMGSVEYFTNHLSYDKDELIVLCMHSTPKDRMDQFSKILHFILKHFSPLSPHQLANYYAGKLTTGPYVLFTFDDGLKNNLYAAEMLAAKGIGALFFLVPDFITAENGEHYYIKNIRPIIDESVDHEPEDFISMSYPEVAKLLDSGHAIGSHTMTHLLTGEMSDEDLRRELIQSKLELSQQTSTEITAFCSPNHTSFSVNKACKGIIEKEYQYHFTTFPGYNALSKDPQLIFRRNIEVNWNLAKIKFALGKWDLARWTPVIQQFRAL